jgi:hypothetical protein
MYEYCPYWTPIYRISQLDPRFKPLSDGHVNFHSHADPPCHQLDSPYTVARLTTTFRPGGGIGRRASLRCLCPISGRAGSNPVPGMPRFFVTTPASSPSDPMRHDVPVRRSCQAQDLILAWLQQAIMKPGLNQCSSGTTSEAWSRLHTNGCPPGSRRPRPARIETELLTPSGR